jgi:hypothetical protein
MWQPYRVSERSNRWRFVEVLSMSKARMSQLRTVATTAVVILAATACDAGSYSAAGFEGTLSRVSAGDRSEQFGHAKAVQHLYLADVDRATQKGVVERFLIVNGQPAHTPDLRYRGFTGPIAVDAAKNVYLAKSFTYSRAQEIDVFASGSRSPSRRLSVTYPSSQVSTTALAVDDAGYLYVAIGAHASSGAIYVVNVYRPGAQGNARPVTSIVPTFNNIITGMALNAAGELFVAIVNFASNPQGGIVVYSDPHGMPRLVEVLSSPYIDGPAGIAIEAEEIYALSSKLVVGNGRGLVIAFHVTAGTPRLDRKITVQNEMALSGGIALLGRELFVPDVGRVTSPPVPPAVYELDATTGGTQVPIDTLQFPLGHYVLDVKAD